MLLVVLSLVFLRLIKTIIAPLLFSTLVVGIAGHSNLKQVGRMAMKALIYFEVVSTLALGIGLLVMHILHPGIGFNVDPATLDPKAVAVYAQKAAEQSPASFLILSPQGEGTGSYEDAEKRLLRAVTRLRSEGLEAHGQIAHPDPYTAVIQATEDERVDELIVSTFPRARSGWLRRDLVERLRTDTKLPVDDVEVNAPVEVTA